MSRYNPNTCGECGAIMNRHHRRPRSKGGKTGDNIQVMSADTHTLWHALAVNHEPYEIAQFINTFLLDRRYRFVCVKVEDV